MSSTPFCHKPPVELLFPSTNKHYVIRQKFMGAFVYAEEHSDNNSGILLPNDMDGFEEQLFKGVYTTLPDTCKDGQMVINSRMEGAQTFLPEESGCLKMWRSTCDS